MLTEDQVSIIVKLVFGSILAGAVVWIINVIRNVYKQKDLNNVEEIKIVGQKITLDVESKPLIDLVAESNKSHGSTQDANVVGPTGSDPKKE